MKKIVLIFGLVALSASAALADERGDMEVLWDTANTLYINGDYNGAAVLYDSIVNQGYVSSKLFYNLGNAHFKADNIGYAVLNYHKAQRLAPSDNDVAYNLGVANSYVKDRIDVVPDFFLSSWFKRLRVMSTSNVWAVLSLVFFGAALGFVLMYMLAEKKRLRKAGFFTAIIMAALFIMTLSFASIERRELLDASEAVVISSAAVVKSSPDGSSQDLFLIHEGTKVEVKNSFGKWTEIMIADGNKGWILSDAIGLID